MKRQKKIKGVHDHKVKGSMAAVSWQPMHARGRNSQQDGPQQLLPCPVFCALPALVLSLLRLLGAVYYNNRCKGKLVHQGRNMDQVTLNVQHV